MPDIQFQVYGINLLVRLMAEPPADVRVHCPKGSPIRYGEVVGRGDGFDEGANAFRDMPPVRSVVAFEENPEVEIMQGSMTDMQTSAWVSPTNSAELPTRLPAGRLHRAPPGPPLLRRGTTAGMPS